MRRLHITAEGQTEEAFVNRTLKQHLAIYGVETAPSKRIINVFRDYAGNKPFIGSMIAHEIGIEAMRKGCMHFNEWLTKLEQLK